jgi:16S rRNA (adenine1518-N6/adenine1519-N6)-dimethyltransferase
MDAVLSGPLPGRMVLMLQQEAAQRYTAAPGSKHYSAISIFLQNACDIAPGHKVSAACFYPRPDIESCLLHLVRKPAPCIFAPETKIHIRACFQQRRKQLGALLRNRLPAPARDAWFARLAAAGLTPQARPEEIPPALWTHFPLTNPPPPSPRAV